MSHTDRGINYKYAVIRW